MELHWSSALVFAQAATMENSDNDLLLVFDMEQSLLCSILRKIWMCGACRTDVFFLSFSCNKSDKLTDVSDEAFFKIPFTNVFK